MRSAPSLQANPAKVLSLSFVMLILAGTVILKQPVMVQGEVLSWIDSFFMATSAVCVTGLSVVPVGEKLSFWGQLSLLVLIQLGGLNIMTFSLVFALLLGYSPSFVSRSTVKGLTRKGDFYQFRRSLFFVMAMALSFETLGAVLLYKNFAGTLPFSQALFHSVFHSVSAFCNSGFTLYADSLNGFRQAPGFLGVVMLLVIFGGLGFIVVDEMRQWLWRRLKKEKHRTSLHTKVTLTVTLSLIVAGTVGIVLLESNNVFKDFSLGGSSLNALFLSVSSRTAGFNSVDTGSLSNPTLFLLIILMFVGAAPGSTSGGIKVTTLAVLVALVAGQIRGTGTTTLFKRKIPAMVIGKTLGIFAASFILTNLCVWLLLISENLGLSHLKAGGSFLELFFEVVSAYGTVGLSTGLTDHLTSLGKMLISIMMFAGRVGPLTVGVAILMRHRKELSIEYAEEEVMVG